MPEAPPSRHMNRQLGMFDSEHMVKQGAYPQPNPQPEVEPKGDSGQADLLADYFESGHKDRNSNAVLSEVQIVPDKHGDITAIGIASNGAGSSSGDYSDVSVEARKFRNVPRMYRILGDDAPTEKVGRISTYRRDSGGRDEIASISTYDKHQGKGIASALYDYTKGKVNDLRHSGTRTKPGKLFSRNKGGKDMRGLEVSQEFGDVNNPDDNGYGRSRRTGEPIPTTPTQEQHGAEFRATTLLRTQEALRTNEERRRYSRRPHAFGPDINI
jgi:hypothetical protein